MKLVQTLPAGPLDIVGDIHGEIDALRKLLKVLGYDETGNTRHDRKLVFIGDFCDRGPDSPGVIKLVEKLVASGTAYAILGNHELNLMADDAKDGSGWFFDARYDSDLPYYAPFVRATSQEKNNIVEFLNQLPIALERDDIRIVHASWIPEKIDQIRSLDTGKLQQYLKEWENKVRTRAQETGLLSRYWAEKERWRLEIESEDNPPP